MNERAVRLGVDVGSTFSDVVLVTAGEVRTANVPTAEDPMRERSQVWAQQFGCRGAGYPRKPG